MWALGQKLEDHGLLPKIFFNISEIISKNVIVKLLFLYHHLMSGDSYRLILLIIWWIINAKVNIVAGCASAIGPANISMA